MIMSLLSVVLAAAPSPTVPPYPESLACAAVTQSAAELAKAANGGDLEMTSFNLAFTWSFIVMESARLAGMSSAAAEADQTRERERVKPMLKAGDAATVALLASCAEGHSDD
ncbi:MAG: hypothetical protein Q8L66_00585 [Caulobacter sp.]|nr:hypothetical protein [Caulobacter sp.]